MGVAAVAGQGVVAEVVSKCSSRRGIVVMVMGVFLLFFSLMCVGGGEGGGGYIKSRLSRSPLSFILFSASLFLMCVSWPTTRYYLFDLSNPYVTLTSCSSLSFFVGGTLARTFVQTEIPETSLTFYYSSHHSFHSLYPPPSPP